ncbi:MAG: DUF1599 domain-containing protein [Candidatus Amulumruptor caecigallinarius]|nr:DUF1599 domain-containing protein [Candidatus Amulumruptor caecigallinarius]MCM1396212.1 DUF1599 domain-containing protein [Candidatus Amulumruptor caecigallinarius]MCM1453788.1 DUF1599 domain-containing protein [bacterium]
MSDKTIRQFDAAFTLCRDMYEKKLQDYGASWRVMRVPSLTDQLYIKAKRIRTLETTGESRVGDGVLTEFIAIVNYGIMALIQLRLPDSDRCDLSTEQALELYDTEAEAARTLMLAKNHDYGEAWRDMRQCSFTDIILTKLNRIKEIEGNDGRVSVSEGVASNYQDIINYAIFAIIKLTNPED